MATTKVKTLHDVELFQKVSEKIRGDLKNLDENIKELKKCLIEGKEMNGKCVIYHTFIKDILDGLNVKLEELKTLANELKNPSVQIVDLENKINKIYDEIRLLDL